MSRLLSILTINKNSGSGLLQTVKTVVPHLNSHIEYIIWDGLSTDHSLNSVHSLLSDPSSSKFSSYISIYQGHDSGIANAFNIISAKAAGKYLLFINAGDELLPNVDFDSCLDFILSENADLISTNCEFCDVDGRLLKVFHPFHNLKQLQSRNGLPHPSTFISASALHNLGGFDESLRFSMDYDLWLKFYSSSFYTHSYRTYPITLTRFFTGGASSNTKSLIFECLFIRSRYKLTSSSYHQFIFFIRVLLFSLLFT